MGPNPYFISIFFFINRKPSTVVLHTIILYFSLILKSFANAYVDYGTFGLL